MVVLNAKESLRSILSGIMNVHIADNPVLVETFYSNTQTSALVVVREMLNPKLFLSFVFVLVWQP